MAYRAPNTYARFIKTSGTVNASGTSRILGIVGTGLNYYEVYNEAVSRSKTKPYDELSNDNIFEILSVSSKPIYSGKNTPNNVFYRENDTFTLKDQNKISWNTLATNPPELIHKIPAQTGSQILSEAMTAVIESDHLVEDGEWLIEITYVHPVAGAFRVINNKTKEVMGECSVSDEFKNDLIPGVNLKIETTFRAEAVDSEESATKVGDFVLLQTIAAKTEREAFIELRDGESTDSELKKCIKNIAIENNSMIVAGNYVLSLSNIDETISSFDYTITNDVDSFSQQGTISLGVSSTEIRAIPGVRFSLEVRDLSKLSDGDNITFVVHGTVIGMSPQETTTYYVSYKYRKAEEDYAPVMYNDYDDIVKEYGNYDVAASGSVVNSISLGAEIAFLNGVNSIVCMQAKNDSDYEINAAIDKLKRTTNGIDNINTIVPLTTSPNVGVHLINHVDLMSSYENAKERMGYLAAGLDQPISKIAVSGDLTLGMVETAKTYNNERIVYVTPNSLIKDVKDLRTGVINERLIPACYAAVAVASIGLSHDPAEPLTNKSISGFKRLSSALMESEKNQLAEAGCLVLDQRGNRIFIRHGVTTDPTEVNSSEITLVQIKDYVINAIRISTADLYVGKKNKPSIVSDITYTIQSILGQFITQEIILGFSGLSIKRSKEDPRQIDVNFEIEAVYPLNYISISFGFSTVS